MSLRIPPTRQSLLARIQNTGDDQSWREFESIYRPAVYRFARRRGLQPSDAEDLAQQVMISVAKKISDWNPSSAAGSFRAWLLTVTRHATLNLITRRRPVTQSESSATQILHANTADPDTESIDWEFRRATFRALAANVRQEFQPSTWDSFWLVAVKGFSAERAAAELGLSVGAIYTNKSRVLKRLRVRLAEWNSDSEVDAR